MMFTSRGQETKEANAAGSTNYSIPKTIEFNKGSVMVTRERTEKGQISGSIYYCFTENNDIGQIVAVQTVAGFLGGAGPCTGDASREAAGCKRSLEERS